MKALPIRIQPHATRSCDEEVKPHTAAANAKELYFDTLDSGYLVATAGSREVGRSDTIQRFHGSEVAFWPNAESHIEGIGQATLLTEPYLDRRRNRGCWARGELYPRDSCCCSKSTGPLCLIAPTWRGPLPTINRGWKASVNIWTRHIG